MTHVPPHLFLTEAASQIRFWANQVRLRTMDDGLAQAAMMAADLFQAEADRLRRRREDVRLAGMFVVPAPAPVRKRASPKSGPGSLEWLLGHRDPAPTIPARAPRKAKRTKKRRA